MHSHHRFDTFGKVEAAVFSAQSERMGHWHTSALDTRPCGATEESGPRAELASSAGQGVSTGGRAVSRAALRRGPRGLQRPGVRKRSPEESAPCRDCVRGDPVGGWGAHGGFSVSPGQHGSGWCDGFYWGQRPDRE